MGTCSVGIPATLILTLLVACSMQPTPSQEENGKRASTDGVATPSANKVDSSNAADAEKQGEEEQSDDEQSVAGLVNADSDCQVEIAAGEEALGRANLDLSAQHNVHGEFPFERRIRNGCGAFPADFLDEDASRSDDTSQCNRAIFAKALIGCTNWDLPSLPEKMRSDGLQLRVVEAELYERLKSAASSKDWLGYLSILDARSKTLQGDTEVALMTQFPSYGRIEHLVESVPKFNILLGGDFSKYPELVLGPCGGSSPCGPYEQSRSYPYEVKLEIQAVGRSCEDNGIHSRDDGEGWVMSAYKFDFCKYILIPRTNMARLRDNQRRIPWDEQIAEEKSTVLEKITFRELSVADARTRLLNAYDRYLELVEQGALEKQEAFFSSRASVRSREAVRGEETPE